MCRDTVQSGSRYWRLEEAPSRRKMGHYALQMPRYRATSLYGVVTPAWYFSSENKHVTCRSIVTFHLVIIHSFLCVLSSHVAGCSNRTHLFSSCTCGAKPQHSAVPCVKRWTGTSLGSAFVICVRLCVCDKVRGFLLCSMSEYRTSVTC
jgi:hypothetical protein